MPESSNPATPAHRKFVHNPTSPPRHPTAWDRYRNRTDDKIAVAMSTGASMSNKTMVMRNGGLRKKLRARVTRYERRYEIPTAVMADLIKEGAVTETAEISKWLQAANVLQRLDREREESTAG